jgi:predicted alpha/beta hydrolase family esterase
MRDAEFIDLNKSTIVRSRDRRAALPLRAAFAALSRLAPALAARQAERLFLTPPRHPRPAAEVAALAAARTATLDVGPHRIPIWQWGQGPAVLLVHGWGGRGGQLAPLVPPLVARGLSAVAFDGPGHGEAPRTLVTLPLMAAAVRAVAGVHRPVALVAHSVGAPVAARALAGGLAVEAAVFIGGPAEMVTPSEVFAEALGLSPRVRALMQERVERRVGAPWSAFEVGRLVPVPAPALLVVHDRADAEVPWQHGQAIARDWPGAALHWTEGLGHRRILRDAGVGAEVAAFLTAHLARARRGRVSVGAAG